MSPESTQNVNSMWILEWSFEWSLDKGIVKVNRTSPFNHDTQYEESAYCGPGTHRSIVVGSALFKVTVYIVLTLELLDSAIRGFACGERPMCLGG
jgi:hypothetical protein